MNKKNVILIVIDGGRFDRAQKSKIFNDIKSNSVFFSQSVTYAPHTIAAMHAVFSGSYGTRTGTNSYWSTFNFRKNRFKTLTEYLYDHNYHTCCDVINELIIPKQGFEEFLIHDELKDDLTVRHKNLLQKMKSFVKDDKNFFLYLHYSNIHTGIMNEVLKIYDNYSKEFFENKDLNEQRYDQLFVGAELYLKEIMNKIKDLKFYDNSIILVMSDHGISVGEKFGERAYGAFCYDYTLRTFAYLISKESLPQNILQQVRTIDFMPTVLDYLQIPLDDKYEKLDGISLLPMINGKNLPEHTAYSETGNPFDKKEPPELPNTKSVRISKWKLIYNQYDNTKELYNLEKDPNEEQNLIGTGEEIEIKLWHELQKIEKCQAETR